MQYGSFIRDKKVDFKNITLSEIEKLPSSYDGAFNTLVRLQGGREVSYWAKKMEKGEKIPDLRVNGGDLLVGFFSVESTELLLTLSCISHIHNLSAGKFEFAYYEDTVPLISIMFNDTSIFNGSETAYVIFGLLDTQPRREIANRFNRRDPGLNDGVHYISDGFINRM